MESITIRTPSYLKDFKCKCGECRHVCCGGWLIPLSEREYFSLSSLKCSRRLRKNIDRALTMSPMPDPDEYGFLRDGEDGRCPMVDTEGYCSLQRECGEESIPRVCKMYPRCVRMWSCAEVVCSNSCEKTVELLMQGEKLKFECISREYGGYVPKKPYDIEYKDGIREKCLDIMSGEGSVRDRVERIAQLCTGTACGIVYSELDFVLFLMGELVSVLGESNPSLVKAGRECIEFLNKGEKTPAELFILSEEIYKTVMPEHEKYYEAILLNHIFYENFPFSDSACTPEFAAVSFSVLYLMLHFSCVCHTLAAYEGRRDIKTAFCDCVADLFRCVEHSSFYKNARIVYNGAVKKYKGTEKNGKKEQEGEKERSAI